MREKRGEGEGRREGYKEIGMMSRKSNRIVQTDHELLMHLKSPISISIFITITMSQ